MFPFAVSTIPKTALWITRKPLSQPAATTSHSFRLFATKSNDQPPPPPTPRGFKPPISPRSQNLLIVGLGNPGPDYDGTRHNIGFAALDAFAAMHPGGALKATSKFGADYGAIRVGTKNVGLLKPTTYINNSGKPLLAIMKHFKLSAADILVLADDVALDCGDVKLKERGSHGNTPVGSVINISIHPSNSTALTSPSRSLFRSNIPHSLDHNTIWRHIHPLEGGHNGFRDIETVLGSRDWARVRIGVGKPPDRAGMDCLMDSLIIHCSVWLIYDYSQHQTLNFLYLFPTLL